MDLLVLFIIGACIGSFLNVVIYRYPLIMQQQWLKETNQYTEDMQHISLCTPASTCPNCKHKIKWFENIPILSFIFLKKNFLISIFPKYKKFSLDLTLFLIKEISENKNFLS